MFKDFFNRKLTDMTFGDLAYRVIMFQVAVGLIGGILKLMVS